ncbi:MAG: UbiD family decarboxylase [Deltaproteobacteria bacterium]|nr:UbiD family decarboxylase [Deltaproteobacteria bacterium]
MNKDLRTFLDQIRRLGPDYFVSVEKELEPKFEPCVIQQKLAAERRYPVVFCERMKGSSLPLVTNLFGSYELLGLALGIEPGKPKEFILKKYQEKISRPVPVREVSKTSAPVKELVARGTEVDLGRLPIVHHAEMDSGKYITVGCLIARHPDSGIPNVGMYRHEVQGANLLGSMFNPAHHAAYLYRRYKELGRPMEVVLFVGHHPAAVMGSLARGPVNELEIMGALLGEPLEVVPAETVDLPVPAFAEIAIEGVLSPERETSDGPFAEYTGYYGPPKSPIPLLQVSAITMRRDAIFHDLDPAHREHNVSGVLAFESSVYDSVKKLVPSVTGVYMPPSGCSVFTAYIGIKKRVPGEGKAAGLAALSAEPGLKMVIVVDEDIDIRDEEQVLWAVNTRCQADAGLTIIPQTMGGHLDPSAYGEIRTERGPMASKLIVDATKPVNLPFANRISPPRELWERVRLEDYLRKG